MLGRIGWLSDLNELEFHWILHEGPKLQMWRREQAGIEDELYLRTKPNRSGSQPWNFVTTTPLPAGFENMTSMEPCSSLTKPNGSSKFCNPEAELIYL